MNRTRTAFCIVTLIALAFMARAQQQAYIVAMNGERVNVEKIRVRPTDGSLVVTINGQPRDIPRDQYRQAVGVKPDTLDAAVAQMVAGDYEAAAPVLQEVMKSNAYLSWDAFAGKELVRGALAAGKVQEANRVLARMEKRYGDTLVEIFPEYQVLKWNARIAAGNSAGLEQELTRVIREDPSRVKRGMAQLARGDLKRRRKDFESAVLDYLRAVYFYADQPELHAEALYKTAVAFSDIGDTGRLSKYQNELKETYPDSAFASKPIGK